MKTFTLNNGVTVLAKPNGDALSYGNRTAADKKLAALGDEAGHARVYQAPSPARGFYVEILAPEPAPSREEVREAYSAAMAHEPEWDATEEGELRRARLDTFLGRFGDSPAAMAAYEIARAEARGGLYGQIVRRGTSQAAILARMIQGCGQGGNAIAPIPGVSVKGLMRRARRQVALDRQHDQLTALFDALPRLESAARAMVGW